MQIIDTRGRRIDIRHAIGTAWSLGAVLESEDTGPYNLTGCTIAGIVKNAGAADESGVAITGAILNPVTAQITFGQADEAHPAGSAGSYVWRLWLIDTLGAVHPLFFGNFELLDQ